LLAAVIILCACQKAADNPAPERLAPVKTDPVETPKAVQTKNEEPQVKIRRERDGRYSWEVSGKDVAKVLQTDRRLRKSLGDGLDTGKEE
jgi:hypothetical protein